MSVTSITEACDDIVTITDSADGEWTGQVIVSAPEDEAIEGWDLQLVFSAPIDYLGKTETVNKTLSKSIIDLRMCIWICNRLRICVDNIK